MTTDALGPCPPQRPAKHMFVGYEEWACVSAAYADWQRRPARTGGGGGEGRGREEKIAIRTRFPRAYNNHDESNSERESNT